MLDDRVRLVVVRALRRLTTPQVCRQVADCEGMALTQFDDARRVRALRRLGLLDTPAEDRFDRLTRLAAAALDAPIALVSLIDAERQWFKSRVGIAVSETCRADAFCDYAIADTKHDLMLVVDARRDDRFRDNPSVIGDPFIRFYAGHVLRDGDGVAVGTLCVLDRRVRSLTRDERRSLADLAGLVEQEFERSSNQQAIAQLEASERSKALILTSLTEGLVLQGIDGQIVEWNPAAERVLGIPGDQLAGRTSMDPRWRATHLDGSAWLGDDHPTMVALRTGLPGENQVMGVHRPDGSLVWLGVNAQPIVDSDQVTVGAVTAFEDITLQRELRASLDASVATASRSDLELRTLAGSLPIGIYRAGPDGRCEYANDRWHEIYAIERGALDGFEWIRAIHSADTERVVDEVAQSAKAGATFESTFRVVRPDAQVRWVRATASPIHGAESTAEGFVGSVEDITDRILADRQLAEITLRFRRGFENAPIGMALVSPDGQWIEVNRALAELLGYTVDELMTTSYLSVTHPDDLRVDLGLALQVRDGRLETYVTETRLLHATGAIVWADVSVSMVHGTDGVPLYYVSQIEDVTEQRHAQEQLRRYTDRLARSNRELVEFASVAAHDLAEPLRVIEGYLQILRLRSEADLDATSHQYIQHAVDGAERLQLLVDDLLSYSRATSAEAEPAIVDLRDVFDNALRALGLRDPGSAAQVTIGTMPTIRGTARQLEQLFQNLLANAAKFVRPGDAPIIDVSGRRLGDGWVIAVADAGIGIAAEHRERIFGMFKRLNSRDAYSGNGIGLAICRKVAEAHGGTIRVADRDNGTTIEVWFPDQTDTLAFDTP